MDFKSFRKKSFVDAKKTIRESVGEDEYILHAINTIDDLNRIANLLTKRLRDWYAIYYPELSMNIEDHEAFIKAALKETRQGETMGKDLDKKDLEPILIFAKEIERLYQFREELKDYLNDVTKNYCKNMHYLIGPLLCAKLIREAGSLRALAMMHASKLQLLGAETALFRHLKTGSRPPKHGIILQHPLVGSAKEKGKAARAVSDKISILARVDYFKGEFIAEKIKADLEEKLK